jgi:hypothetical protein
LLFAGLAWTAVFLFMLPTIAGKTGKPTYAQLLAERGFHELFAHETIS